MPRPSTAPMRRIGLAATALLCVACATLPVLTAAESGPPWRPVAEGIQYAAFAAGSPRSEVHALLVDLDRATLVVTPGGSGYGRVVGRSLLEFAREFDCAAAVNATPFYPDSYRREGPRYLSGVLLVDGELLSPPAPRFVALALTREGQARVVAQSELADKTSFDLAVGGFFRLIEGGRVVARKSGREPMTAAGILEGGRRLVFIVVDGRRPGTAGMSEEEAARLLLRLGAVEALSFDGGGSSSMALRGEDGRLRLVNLPLHLGLPPIDRILGTCIGFKPRS